MAISEGSIAAQMGRVGEMSAGDFREALQKLSETVARERASFDSAGRLSDDLYRSLAEIGLFRLWLPISAFIAGYALSVPYNVIVSVGVWRSAERYAGERRRADLARIVTIIGMVLLNVT